MTVASQIKQSLANLKGIQSTLRVYSVQSADAETQSVYSDAVEKTDIIITDLEKRLKTLEFQEPQYKGN